MKFIFDFDDVLFDNTRQFKEHMYKNLERAGVSRLQAEEYYNKVGGQKFWLKKMLVHFSLAEDLYKKILKDGKKFKNKHLIAIIEKLGKENCYIVTHGYKEWQTDKITNLDIKSLFSEIIIVPESKKEAVEKICEKYKNEKVLFIDDKAKHFEDLDFVKYPNLETILFDEHGIEKLKEKIKVLQNQY